MNSAILHVVRARVPERAVFFISKMLHLDKPMKFLLSDNQYSDEIKP